MDINQARVCTVATPDSPCLGRWASWQWGGECAGLNLGSGLSVQPRAAGAGGGHAGWAVFVNLLETSAYSPSWHLCQSLTWLPKPQDTLTDRLTHKNAQTPVTCRAPGSARRSVEEGRGWGWQGAVSPRPLTPPAQTPGPSCCHSQLTRDPPQVHTPGGRGGARMFAH